MRDVYYRCECLCKFRMALQRCRGRLFDPCEELCQQSNRLGIDEYSAVTVVLQLLFFVGANRLPPVHWFAKSASVHTIQSLMEAETLSQPYSRRLDIRTYKIGIAR